MLDLAVDLTGRVCLVTGANSGLGFHTALELARHGARVTMAVRDPGRGAAALAQVQQALAGTPTAGEVLLAPLDLADLSAGAQDSVAKNLSHGVGADAMLKVEGFDLELGT